MKTQAKAPFLGKWTTNFLSNVLGVIVGIALTFGVSYLIQKHKEKKELHTLMTLVKQEIVENKVTLIRMREDFIQTHDAFGLFLTSAWKTLPEDSLIHFLLAAQKVASYPMQHIAWDLFQASDVVKNVGHKEVMTISELYISSENLSEWFEVYSKEKQAAMTVTGYAHESRNLPPYIAALLKNAPRKFMDEIYIDKKYSLGEPLAVLIDFSDYALYLIDQSGHYPSEAHSREDDFNAFLEQRKLQQTDHP
jgi:hypothetical protein